MRAMVLRRLHERLHMEERPDPTPGPGQIRVKVEACGVCRTDLHVVDGELPNPKLPIVPGHEIVGRVEAVGDGVSLKTGARVGVAWLGHADGTCPYCRSGRENLCDAPLFTGYTRDGGLRHPCDRGRRFRLSAVRRPRSGRDGAAALRRPHRLALAQDGGGGRTIGIYGFGAAGHIIAQVCRWQGRRVFAFTRPGDAAGQAFARSMGAEWAGGSDEKPPEPLDAAILFAPVGALVPAALDARRQGRPGRLRRHPHERHPLLPLFGSLGGAQHRLGRQSDPRRRRRVFGVAPQAKVRTTTTPYPLDRANEALDDLRSGRLEGAAVLVP